MPGTPNPTLNAPNVRGNNMPWDYKSNPPDAVKHFKSSIQKKAIAIANGILRSGGDEGVAIATGIKKAKQLANVKSFTKTAAKGDILNAFMKNQGAKNGSAILIKKFGVGQTLGAMKNLNNLNKTKILDRTKLLLGAS